MRGWAEYRAWRERRREFLGEVQERALEREARRAREVFAAAEGSGSGIGVRWGLAEDATRLAGLLELNGMPRWVAFEERFIVAEEDGGRLLAAMRYRTESKRLILGLPVVDPWAGERRMIGVLYEGAAELAREIGAGEIVACPTGPAKDAQVGYLREAGWRRNLPFDAARTASVQELPQCGWRRLAALFGVAAVPFSRAFRG